MSDSYLSYHFQVRSISSAEAITAVDFPTVQPSNQQVKNPQVANQKHEAYTIACHGQLAVRYLYGIYRYRSLFLVCEKPSKEIESVNILSGLYFVIWLFRHCIYVISSQQLIHDTTYTAGFDLYNLAL